MVRNDATASPVASHHQRIVTRLRNAALTAAFAFVLLVPKLLRLRHNPRAWMAFRLLFAITGASLVIVPLSIASSWVAPILGLGMFLAAILLPPAKAERRIDEKARQLGTLVVVNGGQVGVDGCAAIPVQLFIGADRIHVLDAHLQEILGIPIAEISFVNVAEAHTGWILRVRWKDRTADFEYAGSFAEHLARVAESSMRSVIRPILPVIQQSRAAGA